MRQRIAKLECELGIKRRKACERQVMPSTGIKDVLPEVMKDLLARDIEGTKKYGTTLQTNNGRNCLLDAYQEALDLVMYLKQALLEQEIKNL